MNTAMLLDMAASAFGDRVAFGTKADGLTYQQLFDHARGAASWLATGAEGNAAMVDLNSEAVPILLFGSGMAGRPFVPINYRLSDEQLAAILSRTAPARVVIDDPVAGRVGPIDGLELVPRRTFLDTVAAADTAAAPDDSASPDDIAVLLFTSGTTGEPKAAVL